MCALVLSILVPNSLHIRCFAISAAERCYFTVYCVYAKPSRLAVNNLCSAKMCCAVLYTNCTRFSSARVTTVNTFLYVIYVGILCMVYLYVLWVVWPTRNVIFKYHITYRCCVRYLARKQLVHSAHPRSSICTRTQHTTHSARDVEPPREGVAIATSVQRAVVLVVRFQWAHECGNESAGSSAQSPPNS